MPRCENNNTFIKLINLLKTAKRLDSKPSIMISSNKPNELDQFYGEFADSSVADFEIAHETASCTTFPDHTVLLVLYCVLDNSERDQGSRSSTNAAAVRKTYLLSTLNTVFCNNTLATP